MIKRVHLFLLLCGCLTAAFFVGCTAQEMPKNTEATGVGTSPVTVLPSVTPQTEFMKIETHALTNTPSITPTQAPEPTPFSVVWLADTQAMSYQNKTEALESMGQWIMRERENRNIRYVVQTGDMVDNGFKPRQWENFDVCYDQIKNNIPYFMIAGNHDIGVKLQDYSAYLARPNVSSIPRRNSFERGRAVYATFEAGGTKFLLLGAGWGSENMAVSWMNQVLKEHSEYVAILLFHSYIYKDGTYRGLGSRMFEEIVKPNPNVRLVLCGHLRGNGVRVENIDDTNDGIADRTVTALMYNYQDYGNNCGQLRLLTFDPVARSITVMTYSPYTDRYFRDDHFKATEFTLKDAF